MSYVKVCCHPVGTPGFTWVVYSSKVFLFFLAIAGWLELVFLKAKRCKINSFWFYV